MMKKNNGSALAIALILIAVLAVTVAGSLYMASVNRNISQNDAQSAQALSVAQAGTAFWKSELVSLYMYMMDNFDQYQDDLNNYLANNPATSISCNNYFAMGLDLNRDGNIDSTEQLSNGGLPLSSVTIPVSTITGTANVTFRLRGSAIGLESEGQIGRARATILEEFNISNIDMWNNAVFAADGAANATIRGRAEIRGAVHLLGEGLGPNDLALDISGSFGLGNTYRGISPSLGVNASSMRLTNADPKDLCATLRVRQGYVKMDGSSQIGYDDNDPTDDLMHRMRGIYTNGSIVGGVEGQNVFSENGMHAKYDAGDNFQYPMLNDVPDGETITRGKQLEEAALTFSTNKAPGTSNVDDRNELSLFSNPLLTTGDYYLSAGCATVPFASTNELPELELAWLEKGLGLIASTHPLGRNLLPMVTSYAHHRPGHKGGDSNTGGAAASGFIIDESSTSSFSCRKFRVVGSIPNPTMDEVVAEILWDDNKNELTVNGVIRFVGANLTLTGGNGNGVEIGYKGEGILFAEVDTYDPSTGRAPDFNSSQDRVPGNGGQINLEVDVLPANGESYPLTTIVGLVARDSIVASGAQKRFTVAMYAQERVGITKQTLVAGAIVTRELSGAGGANPQVPTVLYVPNLANRIPRLMPGAGGNGFSVSNFSWVRR